MSNMHSFNTPHALFIVVLILVTLAGLSDANSVNIEAELAERGNAVSEIKAHGLEEFDRIGEKYKAAPKRLIVFDSDGVLQARHTKDEDMALLKEDLRKLVGDTRNIVCVLSGRPINWLEGLYGMDGIILAGEFGAHLSYKHRTLGLAEFSEKYDVRALEGIIREELAATPSKHVVNPRVYPNQRQISLVYNTEKDGKKSDPRSIELMVERIRERIKLHKTLSKEGLVVNHSATSGYFTCQRQSADKGRFAMALLEKLEQELGLELQFAMTLGDKLPDEYMHKAMIDKGFDAMVVSSIQDQITLANMKLDNVEQVHTLVNKLVNI